MGKCLYAEEEDSSTAAPPQEKTAATTGSKGWFSGKSSEGAAGETAKQSTPSPNGPVMS